MSYLDKFVDSISAAGQGVSQKAKTVTESVKINGQIRNNEKMIEKITFQVGVQCVREHLKEEGTEYDELFKEIIRLQNENRDLQEQLQRLTAARDCPQCGASNNVSAKFCVNCGAPLFAQPQTGGKRCPNCGTVNTEDSLFCIECGTRIGE